VLDFTQDKDLLLTFILLCFACVTSFLRRRLSRYSHISNTDYVVTVSGLGRVTCGELQQGAENRIFFPDECGAIQTVTLATSDPCQCKLDTGEDCPDPGFTNNQLCNLCGGSNTRIGDPYMIMKSGILAGSECIRAFDDNEYGAFTGTNCAPASLSVQAWCSCVSPGEAVKQCIPQEDGNYPCDPNDPTDKCCDGECKFRFSEDNYVCTNKAAQVPPPNYTPPTSNPNSAPSQSPATTVLQPIAVTPTPPVTPPSGSPSSNPSSVPSQAPTTTVLQPIPVTPTDAVSPPGGSPGMFNSPPGVNECDPSVGCYSTAMKCAFIGGEYASYKCISALAPARGSYSRSGVGGGAGGQAKNNRPG
jgi:hypothetical protein